MIANHSTVNSVYTEINQYRVFQTIYGIILIIYEQSIHGLQLKYCTEIILQVLSDYHFESPCISCNNDYILEWLAFTSISNMVERLKFKTLCYVQQNIYYLKLWIVSKIFGRNSNHSTCTIYVFYYLKDTFQGKGINTDARECAVKLEWNDICRKKWVLHSIQSNQFG